MTGPLTLARAWMFAPAPAARLAVLRILVGLYAVAYLAFRSPHLLSYAHMPARSFRPIGVVSLLESPVPPGWVYAATGFAICLSVAFLLGVVHRVLAPLFFCVLLALLSYSNSFGKILHTDNLLVLHVGVLALSRSADRLSWRQLRRGSGGQIHDHGRYRWPIRVMCIIAVCAYFLAGVAKVRLGGSAFVDGDTLRNFVAYDNVRKLELGSIHSPLGAWLLPYAGAFTALAWATLALELGAPFALFHRRIGSTWALAMWGFHVGVVLLMAIVFAYPLSVGLVCFFRCERLTNTRVFAYLHRRLLWAKNHLAPRRLFGGR